MSGALDQAQTLNHSLLAQAQKTATELVAVQQRAAAARLTSNADKDNAHLVAVLVQCETEEDAAIAASNAATELVAQIQALTKSVAQAAVMTPVASDASSTGAGVLNSTPVQDATWGTCQSIGAGSVSHTE